MSKALDLAVCMAHPDDECLVAGALMAQSVREGLRVGVFLATAGESSEHPSLSGRALGELRLAESAEALAMLDVAPPFSPSLSDGDLMNDKVALTDALDTWLTETRPKRVVTYGLDGGYGHPDHIAVTQVLIRLSTKHSFELWQAVFPDGVFAELQGFLNQLHPQLLSDAAMTTTVKAQLVLNSSELFKRKRHALQRFETQLQGRKVEAFLGRRAMRYILKEEQFAPIVVPDKNSTC